MCPSQCPGNNCQSSRELQITSNRDLHQPLQPPQQRHGNGNKEAAAKRRRAFAKSGHCETVETRVVRFDAEEAAEVAILSRDCMKHLGDWYYPEGGWGWVVFLSSLFISLLSLGLVMGAGAGLVENIPSLDSEDSEDSSRPLLLVAGSMSSVQLWSPLAAHLCLTRSPRLCAFIGSIIMSLAWLFTSFASEVHQVMISYSLLLALGVSLVQASWTVMLAQYFRRRRLHLEILLHSWAGPGLSLGSLLLSLSLQLAGWRLGLQIISASVSLCIIPALLYRPASVYHPQRNAILHMRQYMRQILGKTRTKSRAATDLRSKLRHRSVRAVLAAASVSSIGLLCPLVTGASTGREAGMTEGQLVMLQVSLGLGQGLGSYLAGRVCMYRRSRALPTSVITLSGLGLLLTQALTSAPVSLVLSSVLAGCVNVSLRVLLYRHARYCHHLLPCSHLSTPDLSLSAWPRS